MRIEYTTPTQLNPLADPTGSDGAATITKLNSIVDDPNSIVDLCNQVAYQAAQDPVFRQRVEVLIVPKTYGNNDLVGAFNACVEFVQNGVRYMPDPVGIEYLKTPALMLKEIAQNGQSVGDCDDHCVLLQAMLLTLGMNASTVGVKLPGSQWFNHVIVAASFGGMNYLADPCVKYGGQIGKYDEFLVPA